MSINIDCCCIELALLKSRVSLVRIRHYHNTGITRSN